METSYKEDIHDPPNYIVYCLISTVSPNRTYVGITNNFAQRIRRHNGQLSGGAKSTRGNRPWKALIHVSGFTKHQALTLEWAWKHRRKGGGGPIGRVRTLESLFKLEKWTVKATPTSFICNIHVNCFMSEDKYKSMCETTCTKPNITYSFEELTVVSTEMCQ